MINETAQWGVLIVLAILVLGLLRQISLMLPPPRRMTSEGPPIGRRAPRPLLDSVQRSFTDGEAVNGAVVAFVTENCTGCQKLLAGVTDSDQRLDGRPLLLVAHKPTPHYFRALEETGIPAIGDQGRLWEACGVTATPFLIEIDEHGRIAAKEVTHRVDTLRPVHR